MIFHELRKIKEGNGKIIGVKTPGMGRGRACTIHGRNRLYSRYPFIVTETGYTEYGFFCFDAQSAIIFRAYKPLLKKLLCNKIRRIVNINP